MFDALSEKLQATLGDVRQRGTLTEDDINAAMREIRLALLEADVNFKVVKQFTAAVNAVVFSPRPPTVILMAGLQGSGKTTATAKLARWLNAEHGSSVALAACDVHRPAAVDQLVTVGGQVGATVYEQGTDADPVDIAAWALEEAKAAGKDVL